MFIQVVYQTNLFDTNPVKWATLSLKYSVKSLHSKVKEAHIRELLLNWRDLVDVVRIFMTRAKINFVSLQE